MTSAVIYPYMTPSESAEALAFCMGARLLARRDTIRIREDEILINWGCGELAIPWKSKWLNKPTAICRAVDKLTAFDWFTEDGVPHPRYTTDINIAKRWLSDEKIVVARATSTGYMGEGISVLNNPQQTVPNARFYSLHVKHDDEYRVHAFRGTVVNIGKKFADNNNANPFIRNWGDWKFFNPTSAPECVQRAGINAVKALGLDFGAADIGYCLDQDKAYVFEVNTAPGTGHNTITRYANAFKQYLREL